MAQRDASKKPTPSTQRQKVKSGCKTCKYVYNSSQSLKNDMANLCVTDVVKSSVMRNGLRVTDVSVLAVHAMAMAFGEGVIVSTCKRKPNS